MRGGQLTDRMTRQHIRPHTPRLQQTEQRHLDREQRRLGHTRLVQRVGILTEQHLTHPRIELTQHRVQGFREHRETGGQFTAHPELLRTLAREQETQPVWLRRAHHHTWTTASFGDSGQSGPELGGLRRDNHRAVLQRRAREHQRAAHVGHGQIRRVIDKRCEPRGLLPQCLGAVGRHQPRDDRPGGQRLRGVLPLHHGGLLDDGVRVRPAEPERRHTRPPRLTGLRPRPGLRQQLHRTRGPVHVRRRLVRVEGARQHTVPHRHDHLDHTRHTGCRLRVTDVRLHRSQQQRPVGGPALAVGRQQRLRLDRVAQRRAGAVRLDRVHVGRSEARCRLCGPDHPLLRRTVRSRQTVRRAVLVHRGPSHDGEYLVAVALGVGQPLDDQHPDALAPARTVRARPERLAPAVHRQPALLAELHERGGRGHHRHATRQRQLALALVQRLHRQMQRHQRRRARRVHRHRGSLKAERVRQPAGDDTRRAAGAEVALDALRRGHHQRRVVLAVGADEHTGPAAPQRVRVDARPLERLPRRLQQQPLLRIHRQRLARRDPEERRVEVRHTVEEGAHAGVRRADTGAIRVVQRLHVPATVGRELRHRVRTRQEHVPQVLRRLDAAGEPARHRHDRDRLVGHPRHGDRTGGGGCRHHTGQLDTEIGRERPGRRVVEHHGRGQGDPGGIAEPGAQLHRSQRVEAQLPEGARRGERGGGHMTEHRGGLVPDQLGELPLLLGLVQTREPLSEGRRTAVRRRSGVERGADFGQFTQERARPPRHEGAREPGPVDIGDGDLPVTVFDGRAESGEGRLGGHRGQAPALEVCGLSGVRDHTATAPRAPRDRRGGQTRRPAVVGEGVQVGVGGAVGGLAATAPHTGDGREQHERVQRRAGQQLVQIPGAVGLGRQHVGDVGEVVRVEVGESRRAFDARRVEDGGERRDGLQQRRDGLPVGHVTDGERDVRAQLDELGFQFRGSLGGPAAPAHEHDVLGPALRQPARHPTAQGAGTAGDQDRATRRPVLPGSVAQRRGHQPAAEDPATAYGDLVLTGRSGEGGGKEVAGRLVPRVGQIDQTAPTIGVLQCRHPAQTPQHRLLEPGDGVIRTHRHRTRRHTPQRRRHIRATQRPQQTDRARHTHGHNRPARTRQCQQRHHTTQRGQTGQLPGPVHTFRIHVQNLYVRTVPNQSVANPLGARLPGRGDHQPDTIQPPALGGHRQPVDPVPPVIGGGPVPLLPAPGGEPGQHGAQRIVGRHIERAGEISGIALLHGLPEPCLHR
ncbi:hypothetical protein CU044_4296 [Streptomyces sp. L-9-10]|nr:hypothetical protein CU044_4296 [Streptomyces sp. L-9-10]